MASRILHIDFPLLDHVHVYAPDGKGGLQRMVTGDTEAWAGSSVVDKAVGGAASAARRAE
jgi:hypothetical protein